MKILQVLDSFYPNVDGPINVIVNIAKILNEKKLAEVELLVPNYKQKVEVDGVKIHRAPSMRGPEGYRVALPALSSKVKKLLKTGGYDIIHIHSPFTLGKYVIKKAKKLKIPTLMTVHTKYRDDFERKLKAKFLQNFMMRYILKGINNADYCLSVSNGAAQVVKEYGYTGEKVYVIRNGTDMPLYQKNEKFENEIIEKYGLKDNFVFLFVGRIVENKNIQFSLEVLSKIKEKGITNFKFLIVGGGDYAKKLEQQALNLNLQDNVIFTGKIMDRKLLSSIYAVSNLFMFPSAFDTCGIVAIEAAANNLASAMLKDTCASEVILHGVNGLSMEENVDLWANEIIEVMKSPEKMESLKKNASQTVYKPWEDIVLEYFEFYKKVLNGEINQ